MERVPNENHSADLRFIGARPEPARASSSPRPKVMRCKRSTLRPPPSRILEPVPP
jgi:hypothetical protein